MGKATRLFGKCVRSVVQALRRVRDSYVRSITELPGSMQYAAATGYGIFTTSYGFPMEVTSSWDTREVSQPCAEAPRSRRAEGPAAAFSRRAVLDTIVEDRPCEFGGDARVGSGFFLRSRGKCDAWGAWRVQRYAGGLI